MLALCDKVRSDYLTGSVNHTGSYYKHYGELDFLSIYDVILDHAHMFPRHTSLVLPSLARHQVNGVEFATKVCSSVNGMTDVGYKGEIVQCVAPQKFVTCFRN